MLTFCGRNMLADAATIHHRWVHCQVKSIVSKSRQVSLNCPGEMKCRIVYLNASRSIFFTQKRNQHLYLYDHNERLCISSIA